VHRSTLETHLGAPIPKQKEEALVTFVEQLSDWKRAGQSTMKGDIHSV
jgi:hypothetical protein